MRPVFAVFCLTILAATICGTTAYAEKVRCSAIRDSAMCVAEPSCWYDAAGGKGCLDGPRPDTNPCAVHGSQSICNASTLNCVWKDGDCLSK